MKNPPQLRRDTKRQSQGQIKSIWSAAVPGCGERSLRAHNSVIAACLLGFLLVSAPMFSQDKDTGVTIRLYSLHPEHHIKLTAKNAPLSWKTCEQCSPNQATELLIEAGGKTINVSGKDSGSTRLFIQGDYRIVPEQGLSFSLASALQVKADHGTLTVLASLPVEEYVAAALAGESGNFKNQESLKAMAVAVRTYAAHFRLRHQAEGFDFCDSTHCQALNFKGISAEARAAAAATRGEMLWYGGQPAATFYDQNCGGTLAAAHEAWPSLNAPYLRQQADPYCLRGTRLPWKAELDRKLLEKALRQAGLTFPESWSRLEIAARSPSGRVLRLAFRTPSGSPQFVSGSSFRFAIGRSFGWNQVRSDLYEIESTAEAVIFTGHGAGHGVGLCQAGAEEMAKEGKSYREILAFYYPGTTLQAGEKALAWQKRESERFELLSTQPDQDAEVLQLAQTVLSLLEAQLGWRLDSKVQLKVYPTLDAYRDSTGQPGWIAAFTRGNVIRLQPLTTLKQKSVLDSTLRHEFTHLLVEARAGHSAPLWLREGLVIVLADPQSNVEPVQMTESEINTALQHPEDRQRLERAYAAARTKVTQMIRQNGREAVLQALSGAK